VNNRTAETGTAAGYAREGSFMDTLLRGAGKLTGDKKLRGNLLKSISRPTFPRQAERTKAFMGKYFPGELGNFR